MTVSIALRCLPLAALASVAVLAPSPSHAATSDAPQKYAAPVLGVGAGLGTVGAGIGIGVVAR